MSWNEMYDFLRDTLGISSDTLDLAFAIGGCNEETGESILYYYTGWKTFEGYISELKGDEE